MNRTTINRNRDRECFAVRILQNMDLGPEQYFVYAWRYTDDTACKLGVSTLRTFYARIKAAKTVTYQDIELLGIEVFDTETEARTACKERLENVCADR